MVEETGEAPIEERAVKVENVETDQVVTDPNIVMEIDDCKNEQL